LPHSLVFTTISKALPNNNYVKQEGATYNNKPLAWFRSGQKPHDLNQALDLIWNNSHHHNDTTTAGFCVGNKKQQQTWLLLASTDMHELRPPKRDIRLHEMRPDANLFTQRNKQHLLLQRSLPPCRPQIAPSSVQRRTSAQ